MSDRKHPRSIVFLEKRGFLIDLKKFFTSKWGKPSVISRKIEISLEKLYDKVQFSIAKHASGFKTKRLLVFIRKN